MKRIAIIPARGGSKRFPGKNLATLNGASLLEHSIRYAQVNSGLIDKILVSSDDEDILNHALQLGADILKRPEELSGDTVSTAAVLQHVLAEQEETFDDVILLQPTNPLRPTELLQQGLESYEKSGSKSLMTVGRSHRKFGRIRHGEFKPVNYEFGQRSQDMENLYFECGLLYITHSELIKQGKIFGENPFPLVVDHPFASIDIDLPEDMIKAEFYAKKYSE